MKCIESDADLPDGLNTPRKQKSHAKRIIEAFSNEKVASIKRVNIQGFFSRTFIVTLASGKQHVLQFRVEPINVDEFKDARKLLGDVVPDISEVLDCTFEKDGIRIYAMSVIHGVTWLEAPNASQNHVKILKSLGSILSRGFVAHDSSRVVDNVVLPGLKKIEASSDVRVDPFRKQILEFIVKVETLKSLPLFIAHADLNKLNILLNERFEISGIVDWEGAAHLPFGMGFQRIHSLAGNFIDGNFHMPETFISAETGFWEEVFKGLPRFLRKMLFDNLEAVQLSVRIGTILEGLDSEHGFNRAVLKALPIFLTYRLPQLRAKLESPYLEEM